ncbi:hypothetical protein [Nonomuraea phyllanthi]|uniref:hypothetical protein n=1 Tax=Nonomuraea phyllanthi TaxID=2219224 RepID=UPI001D006FB2|nr:hypothetical protein [Nonomuraea phyllanthi]
MDGVLAEAGSTTVLTGIRTPRMNSVMERWVQSCRHELLDRRLIFGTPCASTNASTTSTEPTRP